MEVLTVFACEYVSFLRFSEGKQNTNRIQKAHALDWGMVSRVHVVNSIHLNTSAKNCWFYMLIWCFLPAKSSMLGLVQTLRHTVRFFY